MMKHVVQGGCSATCGSKFARVAAGKEDCITMAKTRSIADDFDDAPASLVEVAENDFQQLSELARSESALSTTGTCCLCASSMAKYVVQGVCPAKCGSKFARVVAGKEDCSTMAKIRSTADDFDEAPASLAEVAENDSQHLSELARSEFALSTTGTCCLCASGMTKYVVHSSCSAKFGSKFARVAASTASKEDCSTGAKTRSIADDFDEAPASLAQVAENDSQ
ncbi:unnamed protein product [Polarella glacialis]|uniref:Uncharacterized protein n=1 Tax=Polarella glacialis TaxID=89957 RepID=A0A813G2V2_POLGL|nr:unnamed protein product [Polarella glacialis]